MREREREGKKRGNGRWREGSLVNRYTFLIGFFTWYKPITISIIHKQKKNALTKCHEHGAWSMEHGGGVITN